MNVLIIGSGAREDAIAQKLATSPKISGLFVTPGNAGTARFAKNVLLDLTDEKILLAFIIQHKIGLVVVGPEGPLVAGVADVLRKHNIPVVGPNKAAAQLEGSKAFAKTFMQKYKIPTADYGVFTEFSTARAFLEQQISPYVVKADGLAAGKGVIVTGDIIEAENALRAALNQNKFGEAGAKIVIESFLDGIELSCFALCDGENYILLPEAKDYKRLYENDKGPNTGGMGAVSKVPFADKNFIDKVENNILRPTLTGMQNEGVPFHGFLFMGLMNVGGEPYVIEYNVRLGDPETQAILLRIESDFLTLLEAASEGEISEQKIIISERASAAVVCAADGYPESPKTGAEIIIPDVPDDIRLFFGGVKKENGKYYTSGGRVLSVATTAENGLRAAEKALAFVEKIQYDGKIFRKDIGKDIFIR